MNTKYIPTMERNSIMSYAAAKVEPEASLSKMIKEVLRLVQKECALTKKQAEFCDDACVTLYLRAHGNNVRRAAKMLRATLTWREKLNMGYLIVDEFPAELTAGAAYVAGLDGEGRPVLLNSTSSAVGKDLEHHWCIFWNTTVSCRFKPGSSHFPNRLTCAEVHGRLDMSTSPRHGAYSPLPCVCLSTFVLPEHALHRIFAFMNFPLLNGTLLRVLISTYVDFPVGKRSEKGKLETEQWTPCTLPFLMRHSQQQLFCTIFRCTNNFSPHSLSKNHEIF